MRVMEQSEAGIGSNEISEVQPVALLDALKVMGLDKLDHNSIADEFRGPLIRLASSWSAAISGATLSTRRSDLRRFSIWCAQRLEAPFVSDAGLTALMERHLTDAGQTYAPGTTKRIGSNLTALTRGVGSDNAADMAQECRAKAMRAAQKRQRALGGHHQKKPHLTVSEMQRLREAIATEVPASTLAARDLAIFDTACDLLASRAEVIKLRIRDLNLRESTVRLSGARDDLTDRGVVFSIAPRTVASLEAWMDASGILDLDAESTDALPVFAGIMNDGKIRLGADGTPERMHGRTAARALQRYAARLGISGVAGNSLRLSMARALYEAGVPEDEIVRKGRWSSLNQMREYVGITSPIQGASAIIF